MIGFNLISTIVAFIVKLVDWIFRVDKLYLLIAYQLVVLPCSVFRRLMIVFNQSNLSDRVRQDRLYLECREAISLIYLAL